MKRQFSRSKISQAQEDLWLAEIEREEDQTLTVTLAGPGRIVLAECNGLSAFALAYESLDPDVLPSDLIVEESFELSRTTEFDPDLEIAARVSEISLENANDILISSKYAWIDGSPNELETAPLILDLRIEAWKLAPHPIDLHLLIACETFALAEEEGEIDLSHETYDAEQTIEIQFPRKYEAPTEPAFDVDTKNLPKEMADTLKSFFVANIANDYSALAKTVPSFERSHLGQMSYFTEHFHSLFDWLYARALDGWRQEDRLSCVKIRGIVHSRDEDGIEAINEECVWSFSMRQDDEGWVIRNWSTAWPSVGGAPVLPAEEKPWLNDWQSGPVS